MMNVGGHLVETVAAGAKVLDAAGGASDPKSLKQAVQFRRYAWIDGSRQLAVDLRKRPPVSGSLLRCR